MSDCKSEPPALSLIGISDLLGGFVVISQRPESAKNDCSARSGCQADAILARTSGSGSA